VKGGAFVPSEWVRVDPSKCHAYENSFFGCMHAYEAGVLKPHRGDRSPFGQRVQTIGTEEDLSPSPSCACVSRCMHGFLALCLSGWAFCFKYMGEEAGNPSHISRGGTHQAWSFHPTQRVEREWEESLLVYSFP